MKHLFGYILLDTCVVVAYLFGFCLQRHFFQFFYHFKNRSIGTVGRSASTNRLFQQAQQQRSYVATNGSVFVRCHVLYDTLKRVAHANHHTSSLPYILNGGLRHLFRFQGKQQHFVDIEKLCSCGIAVEG